MDLPLVYGTSVCDGADPRSDCCRITQTQFSVGSGELRTFLGDQEQFRLVGSSSLVSKEHIWIDRLLVTNICTMVTR